MVGTLTLLSVLGVSLTEGAHHSLKTLKHSDGWTVTPVLKAANDLLSPNSLIPRVYFNYTEFTIVIQLLCT